MKLENNSAKIQKNISKYISILTEQTFLKNVEVKSIVYMNFRSRYNLYDGIVLIFPSSVGQVGLGSYIACLVFTFRLDIALEQNRSQVRGSPFWREEKMKG